MKEEDSESAVMLNAAKKRRMMPSTTEEKIKAGQALKEKGNAQVQAKEYKKAIFSYSKVFLYSNGLPGRKTANPASTMIQMVGGDMEGTHLMDAETEEKILELEATCYANMAQCHLKLGNAEKTIENSQRALKLNPFLWKAHWREAMARMDLQKDYKGAIACLNMALEVPGVEGDSKNNLEKARAKAQMHIKKDDAAALKKQRSAFSGVFNKLADEDQVKEGGS